LNPTEYIGAQFRKPKGFGGTLSTFLMNTINRRQYASTERVLSLADGERVLDVGFGNGFMLQRLERQYNCKYYGIEISDDMVITASKRNEQSIKSGSMKLVLGDIVMTDFKDSFFDKIYTVNTVYFWDDLTAGLTEIHRILKDGGVFANAIYSREWLSKLSYTIIGFAKYSLDELTAAGEQLGFTVRVIPIEKNKSYCLVYEKRSGN
jgi:ubiquinone/menaquinone biosynthesis C-methylase UbiE